MTTGSSGHERPGFRITISTEGVEPKESPVEKLLREERENLEKRYFIREEEEFVRGRREKFLKAYLNREDDGQDNCLGRARKTLRGDSFRRTAEEWKYLTYVPMVNLGGLTHLSQQKGAELCQGQLCVLLTNRYGGYLGVVEEIKPSFEGECPIPKRMLIRYKPLNFSSGEIGPSVTVEVKSGDSRANYDGVGLVVRL